jgi:hypothetical protein
MLTRVPCPISARPNAAPSVRAVRSAACQAPAASRRFRNPGPATSAAVTRGSASRRSASRAAMSRGFIAAGLASTIAAFVAMSPWLGSRGGSTDTPAISSPAGSAPDAASVSMAPSTRPRISANRSMRRISLQARAAVWQPGRGRSRRPPRNPAGHAGEAISGTLLRVWRDTAAAARRPATTGRAGTAIASGCTNAGNSTAISAYASGDKAWRA